MNQGMRRSPWEHNDDRGRAREAKREAVLRAAAQMFNEKGFHATSLDDVAARLRITKPTLYYYISSKDEILFECVRIGLEMIDEAAAKVARRGGTGLDQLVAVMQKYAEIVTMDFGMCLIRVGEDPLPPQNRRKLRALKARIDMRFRTLIEQCVAEGSFAARDSKLAAFTVAGALSWIARWYRPDGELSPTQIASQSIDILVNGLARLPPRRKRATRHWSALASADASSAPLADRPVPRRGVPSKPS